MRWPQGGIKIPTLNLNKDRRGASRKFLRNSQGGIPQNEKYSVAQVIYKR